MASGTKPSAAGVRSLRLDDQAPDCDIVVNGAAYQLADHVAGKLVLDIGCGQGKYRSLVEGAGGRWVGMEPFPGGTNNLVGSAETLPIATASIDTVIMDSVLEHIPDVGAAFAEVARVLKPGGVFVGYAAFMECFHEISYSHLSFKALEHYSTINNMRLERISGGSRFGTDYHAQVTLYPLPVGPLRSVIAVAIRTIFRVKSKAAYLVMRLHQHRDANEARRLADLYFKLECLRQSNGFGFLIRQTGVEISATSGPVIRSQGTEEGQPFGGAPRPLSSSQSNP